MDDLSGLGDALDRFINAYIRQNYERGDIIYWDDLMKVVRALPPDHAARMILECEGSA
jgi:hypothetical protein